MTPDATALVAALKGRRPARAVMLQGTGSDAGKSLLAAGLCRWLARQGLAVRPFKPQNMSNNAAVTPDGGEIGRAQALQARACGVPLSVHMNPVLLKPQSEVGSQVVVHGRVHATADARAYADLKPSLMPAVLDSFARLRDQADVVVVEGAGSASEINLRAGDIANMGFAVATETPVVLVADIDRGGVLGSLVGTWHLLPAAERRLVQGLSDQQVSWRPGPVRQCAADHRGACGLDCGVWVWCPGSTAPAICRPKTPWHWNSRRRTVPGRGAHPGRGAALLPHRQFRRSRSAAGRAGRGPDLHGAARPGPAWGPGPGRLAGIQGDSRRSGVAAAAGVGHRHPRALAPGRRRVGAVRGLSDAGPRGA